MEAREGERGKERVVTDGGERKETIKANIDRNNNSQDDIYNTTRITRWYTIRYNTILKYKVEEREEERAVEKRESQQQQSI